MSMLTVQQQVHHVECCKNLCRCESSIMTSEVRGEREEVEQDVCERQVERRRDCGDESESGGRPRASRIASPYRRTVTWQKAEPSRMNGRALDAHVSGRGMGVLARHGRALTRHAEPVKF